jgi:hypothetical protein
MSPVNKVRYRKKFEDARICGREALLSGKNVGMQTGFFGLTSFTSSSPLSLLYSARRHYSHLQHKKSFCCGDVNYFKNDDSFISAPHLMCGPSQV